MPRVNIYLSEIDYEHWKIVENKSQFVADALNRSTIHVSQENPKKVIMTVPRSPIQDETPIKVPEVRLANGVCKVHAIPLDARGRCLQKGCKYA